MNAAQVRCPGCDKPFNPSGLAHHLSKSQESRCREFNTASQTQSISAPIPQTAFSPALAPIHTARDLGDDNHGDNIVSPNGAVSNESPDLETQPGAGEFAATRVAT